jgi:hypothetical protein
MTGKPIVGNAMTTPAAVVIDMAIFRTFFQNFGVGDKNLFFISISI